MTRFEKDCPACGNTSETTYRCDECGHDLAGEGETLGREEVA